MIFYLENLSSNGKIFNSCSPCSSLTRNKGLCEGLSPGTVISILAGRLASPASLFLTFPLDPAQPSIPHCQPGCSSACLAFPLGALLYLTAQQVMDLISPCSPGSQAGPILPLASPREGLEQPEQRTSQKLPIEELG